ncbi:MAG: hypothetical protein F4Z58_07900 [Acidimicrobiaceae bacterium]|nr:hypothetical protein [Acidimicrobiaceae bacterium]MYD07840.1 hypothetical protein [Acidimicrobiaceae bacterium]MYI57336.1 hypothetical protein [Acidimicrobiaceae bacterium]
MLSTQAVDSTAVGQTLQAQNGAAMRSAVTGSKARALKSTRSTRSNLLRLMRAAVALIMLASTLGLAATATAQTDTTDDETEAPIDCPSDTGTLPFTDVDPGSFAFNDIRCLLELGITQPADNRYRPKDEVTREEMAAFMARTYRQVTGTPAEIVDTPFTDVPENSFAVNDIGRIYGLDITGGTSPTTYSPSKPVLRSHMALFLARLYKAVTGVDAPVVNTNFTDIGRRSSEQQQAIGQIYGLGVTTGTTETTFEPRAGVTREQMASFIARLYRTLTNTTAEAPSGVAAEPSGEDGTELTVTWIRPRFTGGNTVTGYIVQWKSGDEDYASARQQSSRTTTTRILGLTKGTEYTLRVAALNAGGNGPWSPEATGTPAVAPGLVSNFNVQPGNMELNLTWEPPTDDGGSDITGYLVQWTANRRAKPLEHMIDDPTLRSHTIAGLQNTTAANPVAYYVWITAINAFGEGTLTPTPNGKPVSPTTVGADLPTQLTVTPSETSGTELIAEWRAPLNDGGEPVENYRVEINCATGSGDTGWVTTGIPGNPAGRVDVPNVPTESYRIVITGLENGQPCEVRVRAVNAKTSLTGPWRWASATAAPVQAPGPPGLDASGVLSAHQALQITWTPPVDTGGGAITGYEITYTSGGTPQQVSVDGTVTTTTITGLTNGFGYTVSVKAISASGNSQPSAEVTAIPKAVPAAPRNVTAGPPPATDGTGNPVVVGPESLLVTWDAPAGNGTNPVLGYVVEYRESFVPRSSPDANDEVRAGDWTDVPLTNANINTRSVTITGLKDRRSGSATGRGVSFDVRVRATNDHDGDGATANPTPTEGGPWATTSTVPATQPGSIGTDEVESAANVDIEPGFQLLTVTWNPPDDGGSLITHYLINHAVGDTGQYGSDIRADAPAHRHTITGLEDGTNYLIVIRAVNAVGTGEYSHEISGFTAAVPPAPGTVTATAPTINSDGAPGNGTELTVTWSEVTRTNGGPPITGYEVQYRRLADPDRPVPDARYSAFVWKTVDGDSETTGTDFPLGSLTAQVQGLEEGASYQVRVRAVTRSGSVGTSGYAPIVKTAGVPSNVSIVAVRINDAPSNEPDSTKIITWEASGQGLAGVTHYKVRWFPSVAGAPGTNGTADVDVGTHTHIVTGLASGTYVAKVSACNAIGCTFEVLSSYDTSTQSGDTVTVP